MPSLCPFVMQRFISLWDLAGWCWRWACWVDSHCPFNLCSDAAPPSKAIGEEIICAYQVKLVTSSSERERDILSKAGLKHILPASTETYEKWTMLESCEALIFILLVVSAVQLWPNVKFCWAWDGSLWIPTGTVAYLKKNQKRLSQAFTKIIGNLSL